MTWKGSHKANKTVYYKNNNYNKKRHNEGYASIHKPYHKNKLQRNSNTNNKQEKSKSKSSNFPRQKQKHKRGFNTEEIDKKDEVYNYSYLMRDQINIFSDASCIEGLSCTVYNNGKGPVVGLLVAPSNDAEVVAASQCYLTLDNPDQHLVVHYTDSQSVQTRNFTADHLVHEMFQKAISSQRYVNVVHRCGHVYKVTQESPDYIKIFASIDGIARKYLVALLSGSYHTIHVPDSQVFKSRANIQDCLVVDRLMAHYNGKVVNIVTIVSDQRLRVVIFLGENHPQELLELVHTPTSSTYVHKFNGSLADENKFTAFINGITRGFMDDCFNFNTVTVDPTGNSRCKIELIE
jgi:hypothetical protein